MPYRVYFRPGCSSCAKTKELLGQWGIPFEAVNVEADSSAAEELDRRGLRLVPVVTDGHRHFHGWNPEALARFVGVEPVSECNLPRKELIQRLDRILRAAQRAIVNVPAAALESKVPNRDRTIRDLTYHLFRLSLAYRDAFESGFFPAQWLLEIAPPETQDTSALAQYGEVVRQRLLDWFAQSHPADSIVETYYGPQSADALLERTVWHAAQHLRQLCALIQDLGITLADPLPLQDFDGLPLPKSLW